MTSSLVGALDSARQAAIRAEAKFAALRALKATFKAWSAETKKTQKDLAEILHSHPAHISRVLAGDKRSMTIETLFLLARAMGRRPHISMDMIEGLSARKPNYDARPEFVLVEKAQAAASTPIDPTSNVECRPISKTTSSGPLTIAHLPNLKDKTPASSE